MLVRSDFFEEMFLGSGNLLFNGIEYFSRFGEQVVFEIDEVFLEEIRL